MSKYLQPLTIFLAAVGYYYLQACPTFYFWDSAELTAAVMTNGVPHPPGFPFFLIMAKAWSNLTPFETAYGLNLFSAFFAAIGLALWYIALKHFLQMGRSPENDSIISILTLIIVAVMGISFTYSIQATRFEVYSLNFAGFAGLVLLSLKNSEQSVAPWLWRFIFFVMLGLFLGVHNLTIALAMPGFVAIMVMKRRINPKTISFGLAISVLIAILLYGIIYLRAMQNPPLNWGDPSTPGRLIDYILLKGFAASSSRLSLTHFLAQAKFDYEVFSRQFGLPAIIVAAVGMIYSFPRSFSQTIPLFLLLATNLFSVALAENYFYENYDLHGYLMIGLAATGFFLGSGLMFIYQNLYSRFTGAGIRSAKSKAYIITIVFTAVVFSGSIYDNLFTANLSRVKTAETYATQLLDSAPDGSLIITSSYNTYFCALAKKAKSPDAKKETVLNLYNWDHEWGREQSNKILGLNISRESTRQGFYKNFLNQTMKKQPIYIEYDQSSAPIARYLRPSGLGYLLSISDTMPVVDVNDGKYIDEAMAATDLESIRTWALWLQNRGEYYGNRGLDSVANIYFARVDSLALKTSLK